MPPSTVTVWECCHDFAFDDNGGFVRFACFFLGGPCQTKEELICDPADVEANIPGNFRRGNAVIATRSLVQQVLAVGPEQDVQNDSLGGGSKYSYLHPYWGGFPF